MTSSNRSASRTRLKGGPRTRSQTFMSNFSRRERHSSYIQNSANSSSTMSTWKASVGERPSTGYAAENIVAWSPVSCLAISVWRVTTIHIPSDS
jgi:hypothetical protein